jgi:MFS family permease
MSQPAAAASEKTATKPRLDRRAVFLVAIAIFAQESVWNFYDAQVPESLRPYISSAGVIGLIMGLDNIFGVVLQPWMGHLADRYRERHGSRVPFILVGAPLAAVPFVLMPWTTSLPGLLICVISFALLANSFKGITETLLPDHVPAAIRSRANGFIKIAVSLTIAVSAVISLLVVDRSLKLAFAIPAALMLVAFFTAGLLLHRRRTPRAPSAAGSEQEPERTLWQIILELVRDRDRSRLVLMLGIFCFAGTWSAMRVMLTPYGVEVLGMTRGAAGGIALPGSIAFVLAALPIAYLSDRVGQVRMITFGIAVFIVGLLVGFAVRTPLATTAAVAICSIGYATFSINAAVALWNLAPSSRVLGVYTGLYTVAQSSGSAAGPALLGVAIDITGWPYMLLDAAALAAVTFAVFAGLAARNRRRTNDIPTERPEGH